MYYIDNQLEYILPNCKLNLLLKCTTNNYIENILTLSRPIVPKIESKQIFVTCWTGELLFITFIISCSQLFVLNHFPTNKLKFSQIR